MRTIDEIALSHNPRGEIVVDDEHALMSEETFAELLAYDASVPTGTTIGKRWSRTEHWARHSRTGRLYRVVGRGDVVERFMGEYVESDREGYVGIRWRKVLIA